MEEKLGCINNVKKNRSLWAELQKCLDNLPVSYLMEKANLAVGKTFQC